MSLPATDYVVRAMSELDGYYVGSQIWTRELNEETLATGVVCQAFDENDFEVGKLAIDAAGKILVVEVDVELRRKGIATRMLETLVAAGYTVAHDWENIRDDGAAWARAVGDRTE